MKTLSQLLGLKTSKQRNNLKSFTKDVQSDIARTDAKRDRLRKMDLFVLDNSLRETTIAALRAHTLENKRAIYEEVKKAGFKHFIVESFSHETRIGDMFVEQLIEEGEDLSNAFAFTDMWEKIENKVPLSDTPIGLLKCQRFGINNVMIEVDLDYYKIDYEAFNMKKLCSYIQDKFAWIRANLSRDAKIICNLRDFSSTMKNHPERVWYVVNFISKLPAEERITGEIW